MVPVRHFSHLRASQRSHHRHQRNGNAGPPPDVSFGGMNKRLISALMATDMALVPITKCVSGIFTIYSNKGTQTMDPPPPVRARRNPTIPPVITNSVRV